LGPKALDRHRPMSRASLDTEGGPRVVRQVFSGSRKSLRAWFAIAAGVADHLGASKSGALIDPRAPVPGKRGRSRKGVRGKATLAT
jgi:hypothetical protein